MEEDGIGQQSLDDEEQGIGQQLTRERHKDIAPRRSQPCSTGAIACLTAYGIEGDQQHEYLEHDIIDGQGEVDGVVERGIVERMISGGQGKQELRYLPFAATQRHGFVHDGSHAHRDEGLLEAAHHLAPYGQQGIVIVVAERGIAPTHPIGLEVGRYAEVSIDLFALHSLPCLGVIGIAGSKVKGGHGGNVTHDMARGSGIVGINHTDGQVAHLSTTEDGTHEQQ